MKYHQILVVSKIMAKFSFSIDHIYLKQKEKYEKGT